MTYVLYLGRFNSEGDNTRPLHDQHVLVESVSSESETETVDS